MLYDATSTRILMLHRVLDDTSAAFDLPNCYRMRGTALTVDELVCVIENAGHLLSLDTIEQALARGEDPPAGTVLTFDDGYREHLDVVAPLLAERGASATFYVATGLHGEGATWAAVDAWYWLLDHAVGSIARVPLPGGGEYRGRIDTYETKTAWVEGEPKAALLEATATEQLVMIDALAESIGGELPYDLAERMYLRPNEWAALVDLGMRVGAHSVSHPRLTQLENDALHVEVHESVTAVSSLDAKVAFAYPDGAYDERVIREVSQAGVSSSVTCESGVIGREADLMRLPRVFVSSRNTCGGNGNEFADMRTKRTRGHRRP